MFYIGIDPSLQCTGIAVLDESGHIVMTAKMPTDAKDYKDTDGDVRRYKAISDLVMSIIKDHVPCHIAIETLPFGSSGYGIQDRLKLIGILEYRMFTETGGIESVVKKAPKSLKKLVTGSGNAQKEDMKAALDGMYKTDLGLNNDEYDALGLALIAGEWL